MADKPKSRRHVEDKNADHAPNKSDRGNSRVKSKKTVGSSDRILEERPATTEGVAHSNTRAVQGSRSGLVVKGDRSTGKNSEVEKVEPPNSFAAFGVSDIESAVLSNRESHKRSKSPPTTSSGIKDHNKVGGSDALPFDKKASLPSNDVMASRLVTSPPLSAVGDQVGSNVAGSSAVSTAPTLSVADADSRLQRNPIRTSATASIPANLPPATTGHVIPGRIVNVAMKAQNLVTVVGQRTSNPPEVISSLSSSSCTYTTLGSGIPASSISVPVSVSSPSNFIPYRAPLSSPLLIASHAPSASIPGSAVLPTYHTHTKLSAGYVPLVPVKFPNKTKEDTSATLMSREGALLRSETPIHTISNANAVAVPSSDGCQTIMAANKQILSAGLSPTLSSNLAALFPAYPGKFAVGSGAVPLASSTSSSDLATTAMKAQKHSSASRHAPLVVKPACNMVANSGNAVIISPVISGDQPAAIPIGKQLLSSQRKNAAEAGGVRVLSVPSSTGGSLAVSGASPVSVIVQRSSSEGEQMAVMNQVLSMASDAVAQEHMSSVSSSKLKVGRAMALHSTNLIQHDANAESRVVPTENPAMAALSLDFTQLKMPQVLGVHTVAPAVKFGGKKLEKSIDLEQSIPILRMVNTAVVGLGKGLMCVWDDGHFF